MNEPLDTKRRWRDDPLSVFLAASAVLLSGIYFLEQRQVAQIHDSTQLVQSFAQNELALPGCLLHSAGPDGASLVVSCSGPARSALAEAQQRSPDLGRFSEVVFIGAEVQIVCPPNAEVWPEDCLERPRPARRAAADSPG